MAASVECKICGLLKYISMYTKSVRLRFWWKLNCRLRIRNGFDNKRLHPSNQYTNTDLLPIYTYVGSAGSHTGSERPPGD